jgi:hypothetical protein
MSTTRRRPLNLSTMPHAEAPAPEQPNGAGDAAEYAVLAKGDARGKRIANRTPWISLPGDWDNLKFRAWLDYPKDVADLLGPKCEGETDAQVEARSMEFCTTVILAHDDWEDSDGTVLPQPDTEEFWELIPTPLGRKIMELFFAEVGGNPTSREPASRKTKRPR